MKAIFIVLMTGAFAALAVFCGCMAYISFHQKDDNLGFGKASGIFFAMVAGLLVLFSIAAIATIFIDR